MKMIWYEQGLSFMMARGSKRQKKGDMKHLKDGRTRSIEM